MDRSAPDVDAGLVGGSVKGSRHRRRGGAVPRTPRPVACPAPFDWGPTQEKRPMDALKHPGSPERIRKLV